MYEKFLSQNIDSTRQVADDAYLAKYNDIAPKELITLWQEVGFGTFYNGLFRLLPPEEFIFWNDSYIGESGQITSQIPFMITAFGDIFVWVYDVCLNESYVAYINIRKGTWEIIASNIKVLFNVRIPSNIRLKMFDLEMFTALVSKLGRLAEDECYGYVPALALGGDNDIDKVQRVKYVPYIDLICQSLGNFEFAG
ncbi:T6SS immunity protein Tdi1 domain-containing protein [uncultured Bacteroides sp.]|uniref:T6SS immunity protein Tdi1 domain-containing protein n=1 Tax=uncultured Bacteroides sp. TaxID=162156 RepID=UPI0025D08DD7|nr:T6SS immunity protein Tdi1 domain-containing protein [uncultured Bacteroides sp.]